MTLDRLKSWKKDGIWMVFFFLIFYLGWSFKSKFFLTKNNFKGNQNLILFKKKKKDGVFNGPNTKFQSPDYARKKKHLFYLSIFQ
jgi:hypothetical protein